MRFWLAKWLLRFALAARGFDTWFVNEKSNAYKLGLMWGVNLSLGDPDKETIKNEIGAIKGVVEEVAKRFGLVANTDGPGFAAGGVMVIYCGFETSLLVAAKKVSQEKRKPIWKVVEEDFGLPAAPEAN